MSNQQSMSSPEQQPPIRPYNDDSHEQQAQYQEQPPAGESTYEEGYSAFSARNEKLRPQSITPQGWQLILLIVIIGLVGASTGALGTLFSALFGFITGAFGLGIAAVVVLIAISTRPVQLPVRTFTVGEHASLSIHNDAGNIRVRRGNTNQVEVKGTAFLSKLFSEQIEAPVSYAQNGDSIDINARSWNFARFFSIGYISLEIVVPASSSVKMQTNAGTIDISGIKGQVNASTNAGTVAVSEAELAAGSSLHTNAGTIDIQDATLHTGMSAHTNAGTITIRDSALKGGATFTTNAGTIHFAGSLAPEGVYQFKTNAGTIDVYLPADSSFALSAQTNLGTVNNAFNSNMVGNEPYARLNLRSELGTVSVHRT